MPNVIGSIRQIVSDLRETRCNICLRPVPYGEASPGFKVPGICNDCLARLPRREGGYCPCCGEIYPSPELSGLCPHCLQKPKLWSRVFFYAAYAGEMRELILGIKFGAKLHMAKTLGELALTHPEFKSAHYDCIVPVPLHRTRLAQRGFNQAQEIARPFSRHLHIPLCPELLERAVDTRHQTGLSRKQRVKNVQNAFYAKPLNGEHILLLDDVMTTGATLQAATSCLLKAGAGMVDIVVLARTPARNMCKEL